MIFDIGGGFADVYGPMGRFPQPMAVILILTQNAPSTQMQ